MEREIKLICYIKKENGWDIKSHSFRSKLLLSIVTLSTVSREFGSVKIFEMKVVILLRKKCLFFLMFLKSKCSFKLKKKSKKIFFWTINQDFFQHHHYFESNFESMPSNLDTFNTFKNVFSKLARWKVSKITLND